VLSVISGVIRVGGVFTSFISISGLGVFEIDAFYDIRDGSFISRTSLNNYIIRNDQS
jgi:hypothetical protein